jgi:hypothetical protein
MTMTATTANSPFIAEPTWNSSPGAAYAAIQLLYAAGASAKADEGDNENKDLRLPQQITLKTFQLHARPVCNTLWMLTRSDWSTPCCVCQGP